MNRKANGMIVALLVTVLIGVVGFIGLKLLTPIPQANTSLSPTPSANRADIDRSGSADESDRLMIRNDIGCEKNQACWNGTVGKTKDGDNPLYVFDLDLDMDGVISQKDVDLVK